jgi:hypothetical protein
MVRTRIRRVIPFLLAIGLVTLLFASPSLAGGTTTLSASLTGEAEVPGPGDPNGTGNALITLNPEQGTVCFTLDWARIRRPFAAHIHRGATDVAGPIRVTLFESETPLPNTISSVSGCVRNVDSALINRIIANPQLFYVNIHNRPFPGGAIRGQLGPAV